MAIAHYGPLGQVSKNRLNVGAGTKCLRVFLFFFVCLFLCVFLALICPIFLFFLPLSKTQLNTH